VSDHFVLPDAVKKIDLDNRETYKDAQPSDWYECFTQIIEKTQKVMEENNKIENDLRRRQERFIRREQANREKIDELQEDLKIRMVGKGIIGFAEEVPEG
jgi:Ser-tRNA(Ala) deacylase AlaX